MTGADGIFDVHVDGELVFEKKMIGRYPDPDDVLPLVREKLGVAQPSAGKPGVESTVPLSRIDNAS